MTGAGWVKVCRGLVADTSVRIVRRISAVVSAAVCWFCGAVDDDIYGRARESLSWVGLTDRGHALARAAHDMRGDARVVLDVA